MATESLLHASDVMARDLITVTPETPILDIHRLFVEEEIHGAPVVGEDGLVYGVISTLDLLRVVRDELDPGADATRASYFRDELDYSGPEWQRMPVDFQDRMQAVTAEQAMTTELVTVTPDTPIDEVARTMLEHRIHRVLVTTSDRQLEGVISAFDLLRVIARAPLPPPPLVRHTGYSRGA